ncbi:MAG: hypothetical protein R6U17_02155 [Thermoplasmata archaeon]
MSKKIHIRIGEGKDAMSLDELQEIIEEIQSKHPEREVFFDGDEYAICSRKKRS